MEAARQSTRGSRAAAAGAAATIRIAKNLELDTRAATQKFGIIARSEAGKPYLAGKLVEGLHAIGCQDRVRSGGQLVGADAGGERNNVPSCSDELTTRP